MSESNLTRMNVKIDKKLKQDLKIIALRNNETMTDVVIRCIKDYVKENEDLLS